MRRLFSSVLVVLPLAGCTLVRSNPPISAVSELPAGDVLEVRFRSAGCFHDFARAFEFRREATCTLRIDGREPTKLSNTAVSDADVLLKYYRSRPHGSSTTKETVVISQIRGRTTVAAQKISTRRARSMYEKDGIAFETFPERERAP